MLALRIPVHLGWFFALALASARASAQLEGPLDNDSYLPVASLAEAELARGDQAFSLALKLAADSDSRAISAAWTTTCEAWRNALVRSQVGDSASPRPLVTPTDVSPWPTTESGVERFTEGVPGDVQNISDGGDAARAAVQAKFGPLAGPILVIRDLQNSVKAEVSWCG